MEKITVTYVPIKTQLWGGKMRVWGEVDKFLLEELPVQKLLALNDEPKENFSKALQNLLHEIGTNLAKRLAESPNYFLYPIEDITKKWISVHSASYWYELWAETAFLGAISNVWNDVVSDEEFAKKLIKTIQQDEDKILCLYGILVYARTLFEQKGGNWRDISPSSYA